MKEFKTSVQDLDHKMTGATNPNATVMGRSQYGMTIQEEEEDGGYRTGDQMTTFRTEMMSKELLNNSNQKMPPSMNGSQPGGTLS